MSRILCSERDELSGSDPKRKARPVSGLQNGTHPETASHSEPKFRDEISAEDTLRRRQRKKGARANADALV